MCRSAPLFNPKRGEMLLTFIQEPQQSDYNRTSRDRCYDAHCGGEPGWAGDGHGVERGGVFNYLPKSNLKSNKKTDAGRFLYSPGSARYRVLNAPSIIRIQRLN